MKITGLIAAVFSFSLCYAQPAATAKMLQQTADSLYKAKSFDKAVSYYLQAGAVTDFAKMRSSLYYNAACCLSLSGNTDSAITVLNHAIKTGYNNKQNLVNDPDFEALHNKPAWTGIVASLKEIKHNTDPAKAKFVTSDIHHFWTAYDMAEKDTAHYREIFIREYFDKASAGMNDYMPMKVGSIDDFIRHIRSAPKFYRSIPHNTLLADSFKTAFRSSFTRFKKLYPKAMFPDVYFIIGAFTSAGTVSETGLLIGINQSVEAPGVVISELDERQQTRMMQLNFLPNIIAHELIHYQQDNMYNDTTNLKYVIVEGMADFLGELISSTYSKTPLYKWATGKEKNIWEQFSKTMYTNNYGEWIANSAISAADNPPDQGYWIGYQICRAYYEQAKDKKKAIADMLNIKDYKQFLADSKWESKLEKL